MSKHTDGPWILCHHLESEEKDKSCRCGYRGGIFGSDGEHMVCEMGSTTIKGEEGLEVPRYERAVEIANAHLITAAPDMYEALGNLLIELQEQDDYRESNYVWVSSAMDALAKAEGKQL